LETVARDHIFAALVFGGFRGRACIFCLLITIVLAEPVTNSLKTAIIANVPARRVRANGATGERPARVYVDLQEAGRAPLRESDKHRGDPSFPSGHMDEQYDRGNYFDAFLPARLAVLIFAALVGYSPIYLGRIGRVMSSAQFFWRQPKHFLFLAILNWFWRSERNASRRQFMNGIPVS